MDANLILALTGAAFSCGLGGLAVWRDRKSVAHLSFGAGMLLLAAEAVCNGLSLHASAADQELRWQLYRLMLMGLVPAPWLVFSVCYGRANYAEFLLKWRLLIGLAFVGPVLLVLGFGDLLITRVVYVESTATFRAALGAPGKVLAVLFLLTSVLILMNLERTFRSSLGTMRWRIKYMMLGIVALFVFRVYSTSQAILYSSLDLSLARVDGLVLLIACCLVAVSLARSPAFTADIYPSHAVLYKSLTFVLAGVYLIVVGVLALVVPAALPVKALLLLLALIALGVLTLSERVRQRLKRFVSRHFRRPLYDYRRVWATFTERTTSLVDDVELCRKMANWLSETFQVLSVTVWLTNANKDRLVYGASTSLPQAAADDLPSTGDGDAEIIRALSRVADPIDLEASRERWAELLKQRNPDYFPEKGGNRVCLPLVARGEVLGVAIVGDRVSGVPFSGEDLDLLKCIGDQVGASLLNIELSQRLLQAREMEAFQTMSAFFVHDLKNTTFTLSLLLQNLQEHFDDPAFRADALRAVSKSVEHMNHLIERLSFLRHELKIKPVPTDLNAVVEAALTSLGSLVPAGLVRSLTPVPPVPCDPEQIQKVLVNLVLNARDATGSDGQLRLETGLRDSWVVLSVGDNGCGMSPEFVQKYLFRPFQTTKKKGIGIGMFHSKMIVDAHHGRIEVDSQPGQGTTIRVLLPVPTQTL